MVRAFTAADLVTASRRTLQPLTFTQAGLLLEGPGGFLERGLVARVAPGRFVLTDKGRRCARSLTGLRRAA
jgi:hypothetical protein